MILKMPFLIFSNADDQFVEKKLTWRSSTTAEALPTTKPVKLINKKKFVKVVLDKNFETLIDYVAFFNMALAIHPDEVAQIDLLFTKEIKIPDKYLDFVNVFLEKKALVLPKRTEFNKHTIDLKNSKQPLY